MEIKKVVSHSLPTEIIPSLRPPVAWSCTLSRSAFPTSLILRHLCAESFNAQRLERVAISRKIKNILIQLQSAWWHVTRDISSTWREKLIVWHEVYDSSSQLVIFWKTFSRFAALSFKSRCLKRVPRSPSTGRWIRINIARLSWQNPSKRKSKFFAYTIICLLDLDRNWEKNISWKYLIRD